MPLAMRVWKLPVAGLLKKSSRNSVRGFQGTETKLGWELFQAWSTRMEITGSVSRRVAEEIKLFTALPVGSLGLFGSGTFWRIAWAMGLRRPLGPLGIILPAKGWRTPAAFTVSGSKIWIGNFTICPLMRLVVKDWLTSPLRSSSVGPERMLPWRGSSLRVPSNENEKNVVRLQL